MKARYFLFVLSAFLFQACESTAPSPQTYSCPKGTSSTNSFIANKGVCELKGVITENLTLTPDRFWSLQGEVQIGIDSKQNRILTIHAGTTLYGSRGGDYLVINRGSTIEAKGTKAHPILFTSEYDLKGEESQAGDWGGLVIAGRARTNTDNPNHEETFEFSNRPIKFGGENDHDNSGTLNFVIIKYAGNEVRPGEELNGLSLGAVGDQTNIDYLEVYSGKDDGIEIWGGTVNLKHIVLIGNQDDAFDTDHGYRGNVQYLYVKQTRLTARYARGIEADNHKKHFDALPRSRPTIANFELHGVKGSKEGIMLRRGTGFTLINGFVEGFNGALLGIHDSSTIDFGRPQFISIALDGKNNNRDLYDGQYSVTRDDIEALYYHGVNVTTHGRSTQASNVAKTTQNSFFDEAPFIGAFADYDDWRKGWTVGL